MISCIILAGGKSSRFFEKSKSKVSAPSKAFVKLGDKPMIVYVLDVVKKFFPEIVIVVKTKKQKAEMEKIVKSSKVTVVADNNKSYSPIIGIQAGIEYVSGEDVFVVGCDMPFVNGVTIFRLMNKVKKSVECVVPSKSGRYEPLCAIYKKHVFKDCRPDESLRGLIEKCKKLLIPIYDDSVFFNINTRDDLEQAEKLLAATTKK